MSTFLGKFRISAKILAVLMLLGVVTLGVAFSGSSYLRSVDSDYSVVVASKLPVTTKLARANRFATVMVYAGYRAMAYPGNSSEGRLAATLAQSSYDKAKNLLADAANTDPTAKETVQRISARLEETHQTVSQAVAYGARDQNEEARRALAQADKLIDALSQDLSATNDNRIADATKLSDSLSESVNAAATTMMVVSVTALLVVLALAYGVARAGITAPIATLQAIMRRLAEGDNTVEVSGADRGDEIGGMAQAVVVFRDNAVAQALAQAEKARVDAEQQLVVGALNDHLEKLAGGDLTAQIRETFSPDYEAVKTNFNHAVSALQGLITTVIESAATIRTGSGEIAQASEDLARRTEANAASLEETSAAITQMDSRLKATATAAGRTVERADGAIRTVTAGRDVADEAVRAMERVSDSAKGIDAVIEGLDKIAFQTRVLAMNAAVEAGRAGEAGRGFAVVADLVSALAMRAEEEAGRARDQLTSTQTDIVAAVEMVQRVDLALADISSDVGEVHGLLDTMAADNQAQATAISQISVAIGTMDQSTQQNAAMVEETSAAARNLTSEVGLLSEQAGKFSVEPASGPARRNGSVRSLDRERAPVPRIPANALMDAENWASF